MLQGISDAEKAIVADAEKGRAAEASEREARLEAIQSNTDFSVKVMECCFGVSSFCVVLGRCKQLR